MDKKVCSYVRVSTNSMDQENSYDNQLSYFKREITKAGHKFTGIYADKGLTGTNLERKEFERMINDAGIDILKLSSSDTDKRKSKMHTVYEISEREPLFNEIWIKNTSRFARNTLSYEIIDKLKNRGVYIYFTDYGLNTKDDSSILALKMLQVIDEQDSRDKSKKVLFGVLEGARNNVIRTAKTIYGYKYYPMPENKLEIIEDEAEVIRKIFNLYADGYGYRRIINYLTENNIFTRLGKQFAQNTIKSILCNEKYCGLNPILKYDSGLVFNKRTYAKVKEYYDIKENDKIPAIVSEQLFDICKKQRLKNTNEGGKKGIYHGITKYSNMLICGNCHSYYVANVDKGRKFYNCRTKKKKGISVCNNENISVTKLESLITTEAYNEKIEWLKTEVKNAFNEWIVQIELKRDINCQADILNCENEKQILNSNIKNLIKQSSFDIGDDVRNIINEEMTKIVSKIKDIDKQIDNLNNWNNNIDNSIEEIKDTIQEIENIEIKVEYTEDELFNQIHKIIILDANDIIVHYKIEDKIQELLKKYNPDENEHLFYLKDNFYNVIDI